MCYCDSVKKQAKQMRFVIGHENLLLGKSVLERALFYYQNAHDNPGKRGFKC